MNQDFDRIYERFAEPLFRFIYRFTCDARLAEEVLHDVFSSYLEGACEEQGEAQLKS
jgi:DNA-directed RNA polymerase specialized sigma24 family protein